MTIRIAALALALALLLSVPAAADTQRLSGPRPSAESAAAAGNARGDGVVAWTDTSGAVVVAYASRGGRFRRGRRVPGSRVGIAPSRAQVAIDERGNAVVAWTSSDDSIQEGSRELRDEGCCDRVRVAVRRRSGRITSTRTVSPRENSASLNDVAAGRGRFGVVWDSFEGESSRRAAVGGLDGRFATRLSPFRGISISGSFAIAVRGSRTSVAALRDSPRSRAGVVVERFRGASRLRARRLRGRLSFSERIETTARGDVLGLSDGSRSEVAYSAGFRGPLRVLRRLGSSRNAIALHAGGRGVVASGSGRTLRVRTRGRDGRLGRARSRRIGSEVSPVGAAVNARGRTVVAYATSRGIGLLIGRRARTVRRSRAVSFARDPVHVDARGRVRSVYEFRGRLHARRG